MAMSAAPDIPRLLTKLLAELMDRAEGVYLDTSIISMDGVLLATTAADSSQTGRLAEMIAAMTALTSSLCEANHRGPADSWYMKFADESPDEKLLGWMIYTRKWGSLAASLAGPPRISDHQAAIYYHEMPRALAYLDELLDTRQEPPPVKWAIRVFREGIDSEPSEPGWTVIRRRKSPDEK